MPPQMPAFMPRSMRVPESQPVQFLGKVTPILSGKKIVPATINAVEDYELEREDHPSDVVVIDGVIEDAPESQSEVDEFGMPVPQEEISEKADNGVDVE
jgi:hypothetical protein